jgi:xanthine dehydrogenase accessory factor
LNWLTELEKHLALKPAVLVFVVNTQGSVPRETGSWMAVFSDALVGSIGGGQLEYQAVALARESLLGGLPLPERQRVPLGPSVGQCCGGVVELTYEAVQPADLPGLLQRLRPDLSPLALFGGGHVGHALVRVLGELPFALRWIDSRDEVFPADLPMFVTCEHSDPVQSAVSTLVAGSAVLIMSFSHAEDLDILAACLKRQRLHGDLNYIGLIGSATKWATFQHRLEAKGFSHADFAFVTCPIGMTGILSKRPEVIAVSVAAQLLHTTATG